MLIFFIGWKNVAVIATVAIAQIFFRILQKIYRASYSFPDTQIERLINTQCVWALLHVNMKLQEMVCAPIATLTLIGSLIGGANAAVSSVSWTPVTGGIGGTLNNGQGVTVTGPGLVTGNTVVNDAIDHTPWMSTYGSTVETFVPAANSTYTVAFSSGSAPAGTLLAVFDLDTNGGTTEQLVFASSSGISLVEQFETISSTASGASGNATWDQMNTTLTGLSPLNSALNATVFDVSGLNNMQLSVGSNMNFQLAVYSQVPEPSSTLLLGLGSLSLVLRRSRR